MAIARCSSSRSPSRLRPATSWRSGSSSPSSAPLAGPTAWQNSPISAARSLAGSICDLFRATVCRSSPPKACLESATATTSGSAARRRRSSKSTCARTSARTTSTSTETTVTPHWTKRTTTQAGSTELLTTALDNEATMNPSAPRSQRGAFEFPRQLHAALENVFDNPFLGGKNRFQFLVNRGDRSQLRQLHPVVMHCGVLHGGLARLIRKPDTDVHEVPRLLSVMKEHVARILFCVHHRVKLAEECHHLRLLAGMRFHDRHGPN